MFELYKSAGVLIRFKCHLGCEVVGHLSQTHVF